MPNYFIETTTISQNFSSVPSTNGLIFILFVVVGYIAGVVANHFIDFDCPKVLSGIIGILIFCVLFGVYITVSKIIA